MKTTNAESTNERILKIGNIGIYNALPTTFVWDRPPPAQSPPLCVQKSDRNVGSAFRLVGLIDSFDHILTPQIKWWSNGEGVF